MKWDEIVSLVEDFYRGQDFKIDINDDSEYLPNIEVYYKGHAYKEGYEFFVSITIEATHDLVCKASLNSHREHMFWSLDELRWALRDFSKFLKAPSPEEELFRIDQEAKENDPNYDPYA